MSEDSPPDHPNVIAFPPLIFLGALLLSAALHLMDPHALLPAVVGRPIGAFLAVLGGGVGAWAKRTMVNAGTNVNPSQPAKTIVTGGPFRFTRNPIYLSVAMIYLGLGLLMNSLWTLVLFVPLAFLIHFGVVLREERYLEAKFKEEYLNYRDRVTRWL